MGKDSRQTGHRTELQPNGPSAIIKAQFSAKSQAPQNRAAPLGSESPGLPATHLVCGLKVVLTQCHCIEGGNEDMAGFRGQ